jgi:hypothetical protein
MQPGHFGNFGARDADQVERVCMKARLVIVGFLLIFQSFAGHSQNIPYSVSGTVHDATGSLLPGASVTLRLSDATNRITSATTDANGAFSVVLPKQGSYQIEVLDDGFTPYIGSVTVSDSAPTVTLEVALAIAAATQTVEVTADALAAETTSTQLGESLDTKKIEGVPLNGRNFTDLMAVQPGIVPQNTAQPGAVIMTGVASTPPSGDANPGNLSISGQRESSNGFRVNGSDVEEDVNMGTSIVPNLDAIESFRVLTSNFDAEYGNSSGGQILVTTRRGTTQPHGSAFEFLRNTALDARNYFSQERAAYRQNQFGGTLGAAPFHSKSLALFGDYQGTRLTEGIDTGNIAVPSLAERGGDFSGVVQAFTTSATLNGANYTVPTTVSGKNLASLLGTNVHAEEPYYFVAGENYVSGNSVGTYSHNCVSNDECALPNAQIPQTIWAAPARSLLQYVPQPNVGPSLFATAAEAETLRDDKGALRADWTHNKGTLTAYYFLDDYSLDAPYPTGTGGANVPGFDATSNGRAQLASLAHTVTFGDAALNEFHLGYMRNANAVGQPHGGVGPTGVAGVYRNSSAKDFHRRCREHRLQRFHHGR